LKKDIPETTKWATPGLIPMLYIRAHTMKKTPWCYIIRTLMKRQSTIINAFFFFVGVGGSVEVVVCPAASQVMMTSKG
jgi:hypothetical protein